LTLADTGRNCGEVLFRGRLSKGGSEDELALIVLLVVARVLERSCPNAGHALAFDAHSGGATPTALCPEGRHYSCRASCGGLVVLVDEAAEPVAAADFALGRSFSSFVRRRGSEFERAMRPLAVVMVGVDAQHVFEMATIQDQQPVETLGAHGPDEALGDRVRLRRTHRRLHEANAFAAEDLVEGAGVLAVAVADQEADATTRGSDSGVTDAETSNRELGSTPTVERAAGATCSDYVIGSPFVNVRSTTYRGISRLPQPQDDEHPA
jgi:hypothetical protein